MTTQLPHRLSRPRSGRVFGGVCAALARRFGTTPGKVRVLAVLSCLLPGPQIVAYVALWLIIPSD